MKKVITKFAGLIFLILGILLCFVGGSIYNSIVSTLSAIVLIVFGLVVLINKVTVE